MKVIYEFDKYEDAEELRKFQKCDEMSCALNEIYQSVRTELKHGDEELSDHIEGLLEDIKEYSGEFI